MCLLARLTMHPAPCLPRPAPCFPPQLADIEREQRMECQRLRQQCVRVAILFALEWTGFHILDARWQLLSIPGAAPFSLASPEQWTPLGRIARSIHTLIMILFVRKLMDARQAHRLANAAQRAAALNGGSSPA